MNPQPVPSISRADVERIVRRDFPADREREVFALLGEYGKDSWHRERDRVHLAALKLAESSEEQLRLQIAAAKSDYRDVVGAAEYPGQMRRRWSDLHALPQEEQQRIIEADWHQYQEWLRRA
jgi:hypothetical protein